MKPTKVFRRVFFRLSIVDLIGLVYLYCTSENEQQFLLVHVIAVLSILLIFMIALYCACIVDQRRYDKWLSESERDVHHPLKQSFNDKVDDAEKERVTHNVDTFA
jgi:signal transduction histidine kinase